MAKGKAASAWPSQVQTWFERYYALGQDGKSERSLRVLAGELAVARKVRKVSAEKTLFRWSKKYHWPAEVKRRDAAAAEKAAEAAIAAKAAQYKSRGEFASDQIRKLQASLDRVLDPTGVYDLSDKDTARTILSVVKETRALIDWEDPGGGDDPLAEALKEMDAPSPAKRKAS